MGIEKNNKVKSQKKNSLFVYAMYIFIFSFLISMMMSFMSQGFSSSSNVFISFLVLIIVIAVGVVFDIIGVAVTTCNPAPFHSMASKKNRYAVYALKLIRKAPLVATIAQDVVGDISGIVSGALIASIAFNIVSTNSFFSLIFLNVILSSIVAGITVSSKAICKSIAIKNSKKITFFVSKLLCKLENIFRFKWGVS